jgi:hypothetical protein
MGLSAALLLPLSPPTAAAQLLQSSSLGGSAGRGEASALLAPTKARPSPPGKGGTGKGGTPCAAGQPISVEIVGLPPSVSAKLTLEGPDGSRLVIASSRSLCLTAEGGYALVAHPVDLGHLEVAYPSLPVGALPSERLAFSVPSQRPLVLRISYADVAPRATVVLAPGTLVAPSGLKPSTSQTLLLRPSPSAASTIASIKVGDIVVEPVIGGRAPGVLARVTAMTRDSSGTTITAAKASPFAAFSRLQLQLRLAHPRERLGLPPYLPPRALRAAQEEGGGISCSSLSVTPSLSAAPSATLSIGFSDPDLFNPQINGSFSLSPHLSGSLTFTSSSGFDCSASVNLATVPIGDFCTEIGCFTVNLLAHAEVGGSIGQAFGETISEKLSGSVGASFGFGATTPSWQGFDHLKLVPSASQEPPGWQGSISAGIGPAIQVLYGIPDIGGIGPQLGLLDEVSLSGTASGWSLQGGVSASAGIALDALGFSYQQSVSFPLGSITALSGSWSPSPSAPVDPMVTGATSTSLTVSWQDPAWHGASGLSGYTITATPTGASNPTATTSASASATSATIGNLSGATSYTIAINATSGSAVGPPATVQGTTEPPTPPGKPQITEIDTAGGCGSGPLPVVTVTGVPPESDGGSTISSYTISWSGNGTSGIVSVPAGSFGTNTVTLPAYSTQPYSFTVTATNAAGPGEPSPAVEAVCLSTPGPPPGLVAMAGPLDINGTVQPGAIVRWAPAAPRGALVTSYTVAWMGAGKTGSTIIHEPVNGMPITQASIPLPSYGAIYDIFVWGTNIETGAENLRPEESQTTVIPLTVPSAPGHVTGSGSAGTIQLSWSPPNFDGGSPVSGYEVAWVGAGEHQVVDIGSTTSAAISIPEGDVPYRLEILAANAVGLSQASRVITITTNGPPGPPVSLSLSEVKGLERTYQASWSAPSNEGGAPVSAYAYCWAFGAQGTCGQLGSNDRSLAIGLASPSNKTLTGVLSVTVWAINSFGRGLPASTSQEVLVAPPKGPGPGPLP